jgi:hypothetical protein
MSGPRIIRVEGGEIAAVVSAIFYQYEGPLKDQPQNVVAAYSGKAFLDSAASTLLHL